MLQLIVFDLDGTLVDFTRNLAGSVNSLRASMGLEPQETPRIVRFTGNGINSLLRGAVADTEIDANAALKRMSRFYADYLREYAALYPGVSAGLRELHANGTKLTVVSNKPAAELRRITEGLKIDFFLDDIIGGDGAYPLKPEPDALLALRDKYKCRLEGCWIVGGSRTDMETGRRAGFHRFLLTHGRENDARDAADYSAESFPELVSAIKRF